MQAAGCAPQGVLRTAVLPAARLLAVGRGGESYIHEKELYQNNHWLRTKAWECYPRRRRKLRRAAPRRGALQTAALQAA
ncbi:hypothetical protein, partial [Acidithiobacillus caldus]|uniref:hypothetical protein n=1 Tax=Acidithiobacillus caldus TaxID=33059 RepID=UPI001C07964F